MVDDQCDQGGKIAHSRTCDIEHRVENSKSGQTCRICVHLIGGIQDVDDNPQEFNDRRKSILENQLVGFFNMIQDIHSALSRAVDEGGSTF